jgi:predicted nucleic acid-binding protein
VGTLIDTSVLVAAERGRFDLRGWMRAREHEEFGLSAVTASELLQGVLRAASGRRREGRKALVEGLLAEVPIHTFGIEAARVHAQLWAYLSARGEVIGAHDLIIAATARAADFDVATLNEREFRRIPRLVVVNPLTEPASTT